MSAYPIDEEAIQEIKNPKYRCSECGEPLYNRAMYYNLTMNKVGVLPAPKPLHYMCVNYVVGKFKCPYWRIEVPEFILKNFVTVKEKINALVEEIEELKKAINI